MKLHHDFEVAASPAETLALLLDPERVVACMPGAALVEVADDGTWRTTMSVKLGPVGMDFTNDVRILEQDDDTGHVRLAVKGRDCRGKGGADATIDATIAAAPAGTAVAMETDVRFSGQAAQLGRPSVIEDVSRRLVDQFAACIGSKLEADEAPAAEHAEPKPINGLALVVAALRGALARLRRPTPKPREGGSP